ncbi:hypothetical protein [Methylosinus sp. LW3]|uniref:hypothetical protein n=1 Tax=Methylosinus sp. LW3 TaxID=107635 RepID=UPI0004B4B29B|nr:hypothetical protein [Methylosinus sp. LW3]
MLDTDRLRVDFSRFADIGTNVEVIHSPNIKAIQVRMERNGQRIYFIDPISGRITARHANDRTFNSVAALFGSDEFADIERLLVTQARVYPANSFDDYIEPEGYLIAETSGAIPRRLAYIDLRTRIEPSEGCRQRLVMVDGPAGVGKTSLISRLVADRAAGRGPRVPILHVTSRGRRLVSIDDAIAVSIQKLNIFSFGYAQVPILVRHGLLQLAIDGFDEFADPDGYKNAWYALSVFLEQIGDSGALILAGRDTFFDAQKFRTSLERFGSRPEIETVRLSSTSQAQAVEWLNNQGWSLTISGNSEVRSYLAEGSILLRPFFLKSLAPLKSFDPLIEVGKDPWLFIAKNFVKREADIIAPALAVDRDLVERRLDVLYSEAAADMAERERNSIGIDVLSFYCEVAFEDVAPPEQLRALQHRLDSIALLEPPSIPSDGNEEAGSRAFPNEAIFNHFLARAILRGILEERVPPFLRRIHLGLDMLEAFSKVLNDCSEVDSNKIVLNIRNIFRREASSTRLGLNIGTLALASAQRSFAIESDSASVYEDIQADNVRWGGVIPARKLIRCDIAQLDVRSCDLRSVIFEETNAVALVVDDYTRFGVTYPTVMALHRQKAENVLHVERDPQKISDWLSRVSINLQEENEQNNDIIKYFDKLMLYFAMNHFIREGSNDQGGRLLADSKWPLIKEVLENANRLTNFSRSARGPVSSFYRIAEPYALLQPEVNDTEAREVREAVLNLAKTRS